ncbi:MAG TPA: siroheme synthase [Nitrospiraceae bacterium]|nr:siroheme synthase [Nitrospiraceae bacterium]
MNYYPLYLRLHGRPCVVIGGGSVAERKVLSLLDAHGEVTVVSPSLTPTLQTRAASKSITHIPEPFDERHLDGSFLVIAATDSPEVNSAVGRLCRKKNILVNVVAPPEESSFIVPSVVERGPLMIAVSSSGVSPALVKKVKQEIGDVYGPEYELLLEKLAELRRRLMDEVPGEDTRRNILTAVVESDVLELYRQGRLQEAERRIEEITGSGR